GKESLSGVGFGMGDVSLQNFLETHRLVPAFESEIDVMVTLPALEQRGLAESLARSLRNAGFNVMTPLQTGGFGAQLKLANRHEAKVAVLFGEAELQKGEVILKVLKTGEQLQVPVAEVTAKVLSVLGSDSKSV
ncbi:MAG: histidine--tRNA ligase, partial [Proteobacteria bacterium]|nr:histidine--tRNA ligase [Pseudomonadota bacterium]